jgi:hypothetical protein
MCNPKNIAPQKQKSFHFGDFYKRMILMDIFRSSTERRRHAPSMGKITSQIGEME